jgi:hypothetical protein
MTMDHEDAYRQARRKIGAALALFGHLALFTGVSLCLLVMNILNSPDRLWFHWPVLCWALLFTGHVVFAANTMTAVRTPRPRKPRRRLPQEPSMVDDILASFARGSR